MAHRHANGPTAEKTRSQERDTHTAGNTKTPSDQSDGVDVIMTIAGASKDMSKAINRSDALLGIESGENRPPDVSFDFVDYPFTKDDVGFDEHLQVVKEVEPKLAVAPDVEKGRSLDEALDAADELLQYADVAIVIPKSVHPEAIPDDDAYRVGYPNQPNFGSNGNHLRYAYRNVDDVHVLGGGPVSQLDVAEYMGVASLDGSSFGKAAEFGSVWTPDGYEYRYELGLYERVTASLDAYTAAWND